MPHSFPLIRPVGHLLPQGEGISGELEQIKMFLDMTNSFDFVLPIVRSAPDGRNSNTVIPR